MAHPRTLALDVGDRRIGLAITDPLGILAQPLFTIHRAAGKNGAKTDLKSVARFIRQHKVAVVVVGHPLHADGSDSAQAEKAKAFAAAIKEAHPELEHHLLDERLTTKEAHALLGARSGAADRLDRKDRIDQVAATLLLEAWLTRGAPNLLPDPDAV